MSGEAEQRALNEKWSQLERIQNRISSAELDLKVALATGRDSQATKMQTDITGLKSVAEDLEREINSLNDKIAHFESEINANHQQVINKHYKLKSKYNRSYWIFGISGIVMLFAGFGSPVSFAGIVVIIYGLSRYPKVQNEKLIISFLEAGASEDEAIERIAAIKKNVATQLKKEQREREMLAEQIARRMRR